MPEDKSRVSAEALVWEIYKVLCEQCNHFNRLEATYRTLASTWLLGTFAAIGFILKEHPTGNPALLVAGVSAAGALGIFLLWLLDVMVYHNLLAAVFAQQLSLENQHAWLPQVAHGMMAIHKGAGVLPKVVWFYVGPYILLVTIAAIAFGQSLRFPLFVQLSSTIACLFLGCSVARYMWSAAMTVIAPERKALRGVNDGRKSKP